MNGIMAAMSTYGVSRVTWLRQPLKHQVGSNMHLNVEVTNYSMSKQIDLIKHQWALVGHEDMEWSSISPLFMQTLNIWM
jgi:hypothetical protein